MNTRLPSERALAEQYQVSRNTVREAMQRLGARGLVRSRQGAGVFVTDQLRTGLASPWGQLVADHPALRDDILEFRRVLEGATAFFAAQRCTAEDKARIAALRDELEAARASDNQPAEASADARLHEAIALASHNTMFLHLHTSVISMLREHITINGTGLRALDDSVVATSCCCSTAASATPSSPAARKKRARRCKPTSTIVRTSLDDGRAD